MACLAVADAIIKVTSNNLSIGQIVLTMGLGGTLIFTGLALMTGVPLRSPNLRHPAVIGRSISEMVATLGVVPALTLIELTTTSVILQATPILVVLGAILFLRTHVGWRRWMAIALGFAGVVLILRPGVEAFDPNALFALLGAVGLAARDLFTRACPREAPSLQLAVYGWSTTILTGLFLVLVGPGSQTWSPSAFLAMGWAVLAAALGYYAVTSAMRTGAIAIVTPFRYTRLIFALSIGVLYFGETLDAYTLTGAALIIGSGLYAILRDRKSA